MARERPIIGVTGPIRGGAAAWWFTRFGVWRAGGRAVRITPGTSIDSAKLDGLIIGGGADVDPKLYGQEVLHIVAAKKRDESTAEWLAGLIVLPVAWLLRKIAASYARACPRDPARDALEIRLIHDAVRRRIPILGICRGAQLLNVHFGGSLYQDIKGFYIEDPEVRTLLPRKRIAITQETRLSGVMCSCRVNALHRHAIHQLGGGLRVAARDRNGIVQAIEHDSLPFVVGVQWHPEYLPQLASQHALFRAIVTHATRQTKAAVAPKQIVSAA